MQQSFKTSFGKASQIPLRPAVTMQHGPYISDYNPQVKPSLRLPLREEDKAKRLGGSWYPATTTTTTSSRSHQY